jgi:hypothetical protein
MAPKKIVKRIKRSLPPKKDGFDPRLVALGAIGGSVAGAKRAGANAKKKVYSEIKRTSEYATAKRPATGDFMMSDGKRRDSWSTGTGRKFDKFGTGAVNAAWKNKVGGFASEELGKVLSQKNEFKSDRRVSRYDAKYLARAAGDAASKRARKGGAIKGAIGGAALAALVQLVAKELNKK